MSRIFITGIKGVIGTPLAKKLREQGHYVSGCDMAHSSDPLEHRADISEFREIARILDDEVPDVVYNLAAEFGRINGEDFYERVWKTNCIGLKNILVLQRELHFRLIHASTSEVYGNRSEPWLDEDLTERVKVEPTNDYAISKWANELQIGNAIEEWDSQILTLRFCNSYGPGEWCTPFRSVVSIMCHRALIGKPWTVYRNYARSFMFIDDFISTLARVGRPEYGGLRTTINLAGTDHRTIGELSDLVVKLSGCDPKLAIPGGTDGINAVVKRPTVARSEELLGHCPTVMLEEGVARTLEWMRHEVPVLAQ